MNERKKAKNKKDEKDYYFPVILSQLICTAVVILLFFFVKSTDTEHQLSRYYSSLLGEDFLTAELEAAVSSLKEYFFESGTSFAVFGSRVEPYDENEEPTTDNAHEEKLPQSDSGEETDSEGAEASEPSADEAAAGNPTETKTVPLKLSYEKKEQEMLFPLYEGRYTSYFGERTDPITEGSDYHKGVDIGADEGDRIRAVYDGRVISTGCDDRSGKYVFLEHEKDVVTFYCHCSEILVKKGDKVNQGDTIALVGSTGYSTGPHLHFEVRIMGVSVDPLPLIENAA